MQLSEELKLEIINYLIQNYSINRSFSFVLVPRYEEIILFCNDDSFPYHSSIIYFQFIKYPLRRKLEQLEIPNEETINVNILDFL